MRNLFHAFFAGLIVFSTLVATSCSKSGNSDPSPSSSGSSGTPKQAYEKKWVIDQPTNARTSSNTDSTNIQSIELNKSTYIIILTDGTALTGTFTNNGNDQLELSNYGTLVIESLNGNSFSFSIHRLNSDGTVDFSSSPAVSMTTTNGEPNFYKTWKVSSHSSDSEEETRSWDNIEEIYATFSEYGTYLVQTKFKTDTISLDDAAAELYDGTYYYGINTWKWSDGSHHSFCYGSWDNALTEVQCTDNNQVQIEFVNAEQSQMKMTQHVTLSDSTSINTVYILDLQ